MISVIMTTYRETAEVLSAAVESILGQTWTDLEFLILQDDPDNAGHREILEAYAAKDARIRLLRSEGRQGQAAALNCAVREARGEYIARMDADDISLPERLASEMAWLKKTGADLTGCLMQVIHSGGQDLYTVRRVPFRAESARKALLAGCHILHPTWLGKAEVFRNIGYRTLPTAADYDFLVRASLAGYRLTNLNVSLFRYRMNPEGVSKKNLYRQYLTMRCLCRAFRGRRIAGTEEVNEYLNRKNTPARAAKYARGDTLLYAALEMWEEKRILPVLRNGMLILLCCPVYLDRIRRFLALDRLAKRDLRFLKRKDG